MTRVFRVKLGWDLILQDEGRQIDAFAGSAFAGSSSPPFAVGPRSAPCPFLTAPLMSASCRPLTLLGILFVAFVSTLEAEPDRGQDGAMEGEGRAVD